MLFLPNAVLWKFFICETAEPEPIAFLVKDKEWKATPAFLNPLIAESWSTPGKETNRNQMLKGVTKETLRPPGGTWTLDTKLLLLS